MLYIITEDLNSARQFWEYAASIYRKQGTYKMVPLINGIGGNTTLNAQLNSIVPLLNKGDELFIICA